jgi:hypothetical protein
MRIHGTSEKRREGERQESTGLRHEFSFFFFFFFFFFFRGVLTLRIRVGWCSL